MILVAAPANDMSRQNTSFVEKKYAYDIMSSVSNDRNVFQLHSFKKTRKKPKPSK